MFLHWICLNDTCALTMLEQYITGKKSNETFIGRIVNPVYNISNVEIQLLTFLLLCLAIYKYYKN